MSGIAMTGVLKVTPSGRTYICEKRGGKKF
jgi:hypothetical protein